MMNPIELRDLLIDWANINSGSSHLAGLARMSAALRAEFATLPGAKIEEVALPGTTARALRIRIRPEAEHQVLLSGHYDTVYDADHPFQVCTFMAPDILRGPGVADMKGGLVIMLAALREFEASVDAMRLGWEILLTPDEETGSVASAALLAATAPRFAFALVFEPARANGDLIKSRMGTGIFTVTVHGHAAHAGRDRASGRNAVLALGELLPGIDEINRDLEGVMLNVARIRGGNAVNIVPDLAEVDLGVRITRPDDELAVLDCLRGLAETINSRQGYRAIVTGRFNRPPKIVTPAEDALFALWKNCARELGVTLDWQHVAGGSDGSLLSAAGLPNLDGLGPVGEHLHSPDEYIRLSSLVERARIAARFLTGIARGEILIPPRLASGPAAPKSTG